MDFSSLMLAACPAHLTLHDLITLIISGKNSNYEAPHYAIFSSLQLLLHKLYCSLNVRGYASHPYKTTVKTNSEHFNFDDFRQQTESKETGLLTYCNMNHREVQLLMYNFC
jgi:hypothetical protein